MRTSIYRQKTNSRIAIGRTALLSAATALSLGSSLAYADSITATLPVNGQAGQFADFGADVFVPQFNPSLGTLTEVSAHLTGTMIPALAFLDLYPTSVVSPVQFSPEVSLSSPGRLSLSLPTDPAPITTVSGREYAIGAPEVVDLTSSLALADFVGSGSADTYWTGNSGAPSPSGPAYGSYNVEDYASLTGQLTVTYTYSPATDTAVAISVPEPSSLGLLGLGIIGALASCACRVTRSRVNFLR